MATGQNSDLGDLIAVSVAVLVWQWRCPEAPAKGVFKFRFKLSGQWTLGSGVGDERRGVNCRRWVVRGERHQTTSDQISVRTAWLALKGRVIAIASHFGCTKIFCYVLLLARHQCIYTHCDIEHGGLHVGNNLRIPVHLSSLPPPGFGAGSQTV